MGKTAFIFPGQGSQYAGMGKPLWERDEGVRALYGLASDIAGFDVGAASFGGAADALDGDVTAQAAVLTCNEACRMAASESGHRPDIVTGYSLGYYSALVAAGVLSFKDALGLVMRAGELALRESGRISGAMAAIIGLPLGEVEEICGGSGDVWVSNINASTQILVSGVRPDVEAAVSEAGARGALSAFMLNMGAAYHSPLMERAVDSFGEYVYNTAFDEPNVPVMSYLDASPVETGEAAAEVVRTQLARKVLWKDTVNAMTASGVDSFIEIGPGNALCRMVRWVNRGVSVRPVEEILGIAREEGARRA